MKKFMTMITAMLVVMATNVMVFADDFQIGATEAMEKPEIVNKANNFIWNMFDWGVGLTLGLVALAFLGIVIKENILEEKGGNSQIKSKLLKVGGGLVFIMAIKQLIAFIMTTFG